MMGRGIPVVAWRMLGLFLRLQVADGVEETAGNAHRVHLVHISFTESRILEVS